MTGNLSASILARLLTLAKQRGDDYNLLLNRFGMERLLARISASPHADRFLLKGALLFALWYDTPHRPTRDADLLGFGPNDEATRSPLSATSPPWTWATASCSTPTP